MPDYSALRAKRSSIWQHFTPVPGKLNKAKCDTCGIEYSFGGGSTTNLATHIRKKHPSLAENLPRKKQRTTTRAVASEATPSSDQATTSTERSDDIVPQSSDNPSSATTSTSGNNSAEPVAGKMHQVHLRFHQLYQNNVSACRRSLEGR